MDRKIISSVLTLSLIAVFGCGVSSIDNQQGHEVSRVINTPILVDQYEFAKGSDDSTASTSVDAQRVTDAHDRNDASDLPAVEGKTAAAPPTPVWGFGIVVGLDGTGGTSISTKNLVAESLMNVTLASDNSDGKPLERHRFWRSVTMVIVTAEVPRDAKSGDLTNTLVSVMDDGESLVGGTLLSTTLCSADGKVRAIALGPISARSLIGRHLTAATVRQGAVVR